MVKEVLLAGKTLAQEGSGKGKSLTTETRNGGEVRGMWAVSRTRALGVGIRSHRE